jgi:sugar lactone lactonase YvrE
MTSKDNKETKMTDANRPTLIAEGLAFAEAPRWHNGKLWFSDFYTHKVISIDQSGKHSTVAEVPGQPSGLGWLPDGRLLVVSMTDRRLLRQDGDTLTEVADLSALAPFHCNDMVVDKQGRAYIGNFGFDLVGRAPVKPTVLLLVTPEGQVRVAADDLLFPNGCVITPDEQTLIVAETFGKRLTAFTISDDGSLTGRRVWADLGDASPDGICLDAEGAVWVASPTTSEFIRVREGGEVTDRVASDIPAIACALGGADRRTLYMVGGKVSKPEKSLAERIGRITAIQVAVPGAGLP